MHSEIGSVESTFTTRPKKHSQSVSYFTVPPRAHPSTGSQSGSATPGRTQVPSTRSRGLLNCRKKHGRPSARHSHLAARTHQNRFILMFATYTAHTHTVQSRHTPGHSQHASARSPPGAVVHVPSPTSVRARFLQVNLAVKPVGVSTPFPAQRGATVHNLSFPTPVGTSA